MNVRRHFRSRNRMRFLAAPFSQHESIVKMDRYSASQVRQPEINATVTAISRPKQRKERLVLVDRQQLSIAERPAFRWKDKTHDADFGKKWFSHGSLIKIGSFEW